MTFCNRFTLLVVLVVPTAIMAKNCTLDCMHDTVCAEGEANFTWHPVDPTSGEAFDFHQELSRDGYHCACPPGLTGLRCGRKYESCNDGTHMCYNGGQCIATMKDIYQNDQQFCDCAATVNEDGNTVRYSGKYCEVEVISHNTRCDKDNNICQNGGTCKKAVDEIDPCDCPDGFVGRMCEFFEPSVPDCDLQCQNGGSCRYGTKTEDHSLVLGSNALNAGSINGGSKTAKVNSVNVVHENYMYCECPQGFMGVKCEEENSVCGDIKCKHGSKCVSVNNKDTGATTYHCDCAEINAKKLEHGNEKQYAGRHCEVESTVVCHYPDTEDTTFCANKGACPDRPHQHCSCREGFHGSRCEIASNTTDVTLKECKLECKNGGECREGSKQDAHVQELIEKYGSELSSMKLNVTHDQNFEHCACPDGFVGVQCEYSMTTCGENGEAHPCFHGSTCNMIGGVPTCVCDDPDAPTAGIYCQHVATETCNINQVRGTQDTEQENGNKGFCVNGGVCVKDKNGDNACRCHSQFEGPHCEYTKNITASASQATANDNSPSSNPNKSGAAKFGVTLLVLFCGAVVGFGIVVYRRKRVITEDCPPVYPDLDHNLALDDQSLRAAPVVDVGPEKDFDGNELKDVEFT